MKTALANKRGRSLFLLCHVLLCWFPSPADSWCLHKPVCLVREGTRVACDFDVAFATILLAACFETADMFLFATLGLRAIGAKSRPKRKRFNNEAVP